MKILILGGTGEARELANRLVDAGHDVTTSLAGRTQTPEVPPGNLRVGGFGGAAGLAAYLRASNIDHMVDATHPYAGQISVNAVAAAQMADIPLTRYMRPEWVRQPGADWTIVQTAAEAAPALPTGANVLLTTGQGGLETFLEREDCRFIVRTIERPAFELPSHATLLQRRPPYRLLDEMALMESEGITHLVTKNSGGEQTAAKLDAAQRLGVKIIMIARPYYGPAREVTTLDEAVAALAG